MDVHGVHARAYFRGDTVHPLVDAHWGSCTLLHCLPCICYATDLLHAGPLCDRCILSLDPNRHTSLLHVGNLPALQSPLCALLISSTDACRTQMVRRGRTGQAVRPAQACAHPAPRMRGALAPAAAGRQPPDRPRRPLPPGTPAGARPRGFGVSTISHNPHCHRPQRRSLATMHVHAS